MVLTSSVREQLKASLVLFCLCVLGTASAQTGSTLTYLRSFDVADRPDGVAFNAATDEVFFVSDNAEVFRLSRNGTPLGSFTVGAGDVDLRGITVFGGGFLGANDQAPKSIVEFDSSGVLGGISFDLDAGGVVDVNDSNGIAFDPSTNTILHADEDDDVVREFSLAGALLTTIDISSIVGDAEGIEVNPVNGNLLIADDLGGGVIYELTRAGALVSQWSSDDLLAGTGQTGWDSLGLALDRGRNELYVAQGGQDRIDVFAFNGGQPATPVPVPSLLLPGLVVGLIGLAGWRLRRRSPRA